MARVVTWRIAELLFGLLAGASAALAADPIKGWGNPVDPGSDCQVRLDGQALAITLPASKPNELRAETGKRTAPRVLRDIEGNHVVTVKVTGDFAPDGQAAGLLHWLDDRNFVKFTRAQGMAPTLEYWRDGQLQPPPAGAEVPATEGQAAYLRLTRRMDKLKAEISPDAESWTEVGTIPIRLSSRLLLGVVATNTTDQPLDVRFEGLTVKGIPLYPTGN